MKRRPARFAGREMGEKSPHELGGWLPAQLRDVDDPVELLQHVVGVLPDELRLERLVGVWQVVRLLQDVLELGHRQLQQGWEYKIELQDQIHRVQPVKRGFC